MKDKDLLRAMTDIREEYILEAAPDNLLPKKIPVWKKPAFRVTSGLLAACLVLVIGLGVFHFNRIGSKDSAVTNQEYEKNMAGEEAPEGAAQAGEEAYQATQNAAADAFKEAPGLQEDQVSDSESILVSQWETQQETETVTEEMSE